MKLCPHCMQPSETEICPHCGKPVSYTAAPNHLPVGTVLNAHGLHSYSLGAVIGQGGFGATYIAYDQTSKIRVAVKEYYPARCARRVQGQIVPEAGKDTVYVSGMESFLKEAKTLAGIEKMDSVVQVLDYFQENNTAYLVMEYLDGTPLHTLVQKNGPFSAQDLLPKLPALMRDLSRLHARGTIHRDIAPDNIMLMPDGSLKLLDFGSARSVLDAQSMTVLLKHGFAPIEQYQTHGQGPWTDVYALCGTIYYCLTGQVPMSSLDRLDGEVMPAPSALGAQLTAQQEEVLLWGMTLQPKDRPQNMEEFSARFLRVLPMATLAHTFGSTAKRPAKAAEQPQTVVEEMPKTVPQPVPEPVVEPIQPEPQKKKSGFGAWIRSHVAIVAGCAAAVLLIAVVLGVVLLGGKDNDTSADKPHTSGDSTGDLFVPNQTEEPDEPEVPEQPEEPDEPEEPEEPEVPEEPEQPTVFESDGFHYVVEDDEVVIVDYTGTEAELAIPAEIDGCPVTTIRHRAFEGNTTITSVYFSSSMAYIASYAFEDCTALEYVFSDSAYVTVSSDAFLGCTALRLAWVTDSPSHWKLDKTPVYNVNHDTGAGLLVDIYPGNYGEFYALTDTGEMILLYLDPDTYIVYLEETVNDIPVTWADPTATQHITEEGYLVYVPAEMSFPPEMVYDVTWTAEPETFADNWYFTCVACAAINEVRDAEYPGAPHIRPSEEAIRACMLRAPELAISYGHNRPDGSDWGSALDEYYPEDWQYGTHSIWGLDAAANFRDDRNAIALSVTEDYAYYDYWDTFHFYRNLGVAYHHSEEDNKLYATLIVFVGPKEEIY